MKNPKFKELLQTLSPQFYQFAFVMVPDDLQAQQIVIDACSAFLFEQTNLLESFRVDQTSPQKVKLDRLYRGVLPYIYQLGIKRSLQLEGQINAYIKNNKNTDFYRLEVSKRALLYLRIKKSFSYDELEKMSKLPRSAVIEKVYHARELLLSQTSLQGVDQQI